MKRPLISTVLLALTLAISGTAVAAVTTQTILHSYGSGDGQVDPPGTDGIGDGYVNVSDNSATLFSDSFSFSNLGYSSISRLVLTLNYGYVASYEAWNTHAGYGATSTIASLPALSGAKPAVYTFDSTRESNTFDAMVAGNSLNLSFSETTRGNDSFWLRSASLAVTGVPAVPEPETYAMLMAGLGLIGTIARRRKQGKA